MEVSLGIDTGGTYTDAVLFVEGQGVVAKAKSLTTRHDLTIGIAGAVDRVMATAGAAATGIGLVSLSTTLATNALVEGRGGRVCLVFIGFDDADAHRAGLAEALRSDPVIRLSGGHDPQGDAAGELDLEALRRQAVLVAPSVSGFAVTAKFATRNPEHELAAREVLLTLTGLPVTCGHELSAKLNGPRRALTSVLNARLIGLVTGLIAAAEEIIATHSIEAPLMVVRGDGSLMSAELARARPIETILSGPAASLVGATFLTGALDAIVSDIGGTTTDVALVEGGAPHLDPDGATVGGHRTMVEAVAMTTVGLGGDSEVVVTIPATGARLRLGPRRVVPISMAAIEHPAMIHAALDQQALQEIPGDHDARFVLPVADAGATADGLDSRELQLLERIRAGAAPIGRIVGGLPDLRRLDRLVARGLVMLSGFTPTDASHVLGDHVTHDVTAATKAARLMGRKRDVLGRPVRPDPVEFSEWVVSSLQRRSAELVLDVAMGRDGFEGPAPSEHPTIASSLEARSGIVDIAVRLTVPLVALGASAAIYYPAVAAMLRTAGIVPADADVANAIGAVVGQVRVRAEVYVSAPERGRFRVHHADAPSDLDGLDAALAVARRLADVNVRHRAATAGAGDFHVSFAERVSSVAVDGAELFVEATITATASGRPRRTH